MRGILLLAIFTAITVAGYGQCNDLLISEYVEGSRNNRALELYNPSSDSIDLSKYRITSWLDGGSTWVPGISDTLSGYLLPNQVIVLVYNHLDSNLGGADTAVFKVLQEKADLFIGKMGGTMKFDGDDAVSLDKYIGEEFLPIDIIGKIGQKPELSSQINGHVGWTDSFPFSTGVGTSYTENHTLIRRQDVKRGVNINPAYFDPTKEWQIYPMDMFDSLGSHRCACNKYAAKLSTAEKSHIRVGPNPVGDELHIHNQGNIVQMNIQDLSGRLRQSLYIRQTELFLEWTKMDVSAFNDGVYILRILDINGNVTNFKFVKKSH
jgi:hypothetical protein